MLIAARCDEELGPVWADTAAAWERARGGLAVGGAEQDLPAGALVRVKVGEQSDRAEERGDLVEPRLRGDVLEPVGVGKTR